MIRKKDKIDGSKKVIYSLSNEMRGHQERKYFIKKIQVKGVKNDNWGHPSPRKPHGQRVCGEGEGGESL
jgi:hypothetical protein